MTTKRFDTNIALWGLFGLLMVAFAGVLVWNLRDTSAKEGGPAPAFALRTDQGQEVTAKSFGGKILILNFWATWCAPCVEEIPSLSAFQRKYERSGVVVLAVSVDKNPQKYKAFLNRIHVSFDTARDPAENVSSEYGTFQFPESYIIKDGRVMRKFPEAEDWLSDDIDHYVKSLL
ncbi:MAG TPA: TlpA disulfide reductase family protein [Bryobacteraceae bacterium]|nr:TlpA disulfide reductase family protein [Bryobacteraceae bacterium]